MGRENYSENPEGKEVYTTEPIQWPENFPQELLQQLPTELQNGPEVKTTIEFQHDAHGRIVRATYQTSDTRSFTTFPENLEKEFIFSYDDKGKLMQVDTHTAGVERLTSPSPLHDEPYTQDSTIRLQWHTSGSQKGTFDRLEITHDSKR